jgi:hypothetical protein
MWFQSQRVAPIFAPLVRVAHHGRSSWWSKPMIPRARTESNRLGFHSSLQEHALDDSSTSQYALSFKKSTSSEQHHLGIKLLTHGTLCYPNHSTCYWSSSFCIFFTSPWTHGPLPCHFAIFLEGNSISPPFQFVLWSIEGGRIASMSVWGIDVKSLCVSACPLEHVSYLCEKDMSRQVRQSQKEEHR